MLGLTLILFAGSGCTRSYYRDFADRDVYQILTNRLTDWRWRVPKRLVEADPSSRMADPENPNREPIPPDEVEARRFQVSSAFPFEFHGWKKRGTEPIEFLDWQRNITIADDGRLVLSRDSIMREAMINSRDYQFRYEDLYLSALSLTLAQFQFMIQGFSRNGLWFQHFGGPRNDSNQLQMTTNSGFTRQFMTGAQLLVDFANQVVFEYSGKGFNTVAPNLAINFTQPLLRGAWARIATQALSLQERGVLYAVRDFAHYRREFYVGLIAGQGYLGLLTDLQLIRNQEENVRSLARNLEMYEVEYTMGYKTILERDQIAQDFQRSQLQLLQSEASLQNQIDAFKVRLGLPPEMTVRLDDTALDPFQLNDTRLDTLRTSNQELYLELLQEDSATKPVLADAAVRILKSMEELQIVLNSVFEELDQWREKLAAEERQEFTGPDAAEAKAFYKRRRELSERIATVLQETKYSLEDNVDNLQKLAIQIDQADTEESYKELLDSLRDITNKDLRSRLAEVFVTQTQTRVYLIELKPIDLTVDQAIQIALTNRLDLMNAQARVTDAWRIVEVEANSLQGFLNFNYSANMASAPEHSNWLRFDSSASTHRVGITFDAPINRRIERNAYRASQIGFQRARRAYMQTRDEIVRQIRFDMRELLLSRKQFDIGREQLITTSRQLEQAEYALQQVSEGQSVVTLNLLRALQTLLDARNTLIGIWIRYETARMNLFRDFDLMDIDANGIWTNENDSELLAAALRIAAESPAFSLSIPAGVPDLTAEELERDVIFSDVQSKDRDIPGEPERLSEPIDESELESDVPPAPPIGPSPFGAPR